jgi:hypothetical protein
MKKTIQLLASLTAAFAVLTLQSCDPEEPTAVPVVTAPTAVTAVQIGAKVDVTFTFVAAGGYASAAVTASGGTATVKTAGTASAVEGSVVVEFTADNTAGAATVSLTVTDDKGQAGNAATATLNKTISAPPTVTLSSATASGNPGANITVTATITAANGFKSLTYTTTGGLTGAPASPINTITGTTQELTFTIPATAAIGATMTAVITVADNQNLNSTAQTFTVTATTNELTGNLTANKTLNKGESYLIKGTYVVMSGVTLTVQAGAIIKGDKASKGVLVVKQGGTLIANGTATEPIVFTSAQPAGERDRGDWGGIIIMGDAYVNQTAQPSVEGLTPPPSDANFYKYGTVDATQASATVGTNNQNSGSLKYVRIEYAGIELIPNSETNALTMAAVGDGTTIDYVQVSYGGDDGFEWFGGTVNAKHLVSLAIWDDDFDTDFGWRGNVQWGVAVRAAFVADQSGSTTFESDSQGNGNPIGSVCTDAVKTGCTRGVFSNISVFGPRDYNRAISGNYTRAMHIRRRTAISIFNSVIAGYHAGLQIDDAGTATNYLVDNTGEGRLSNNVMLLSFLPAATTGGATAVTSIAAASGNVAYAGGTAPSTAQAVWEAAAAGNTTTPTYFYSRWNAGQTAQTIAGNFASSASTIAAAEVAFATVPGWAAGTAVDVINPYTALGINTASATTPFYAGSTTANYPSNPTLEIAANGSLATGASFADSKLAAFLPAAGFDNAVTYRGAFGTTDWTNGWSEFQPLNKAY